MEHESVREVEIARIQSGRRTACADFVAVEEPLEIRLGYTQEGKRMQRSLSITMRTPGQDFDLAAGFLAAEGVLQRPEQLATLRYCGKPAPGSTHRNVVRVELTPEVALDFGRLERHFYTTSSCGVCGKTSLEALAVGCPAPITSSFQIAPEVVSSLPAKLRAAQEAFDSTGGLHAAALFTLEGELLRLREDVGRHNALDKLTGAYFREGALPLSNHLLLVSGRASFELLQKTLMAGIPLLAAVGAPSSLAVDLARQFHITLIGFVRENRFNVYSGGERLLA